MVSLGIGEQVSIRFLFSTEKFPEIPRITRSLVRFSGATIIRYIYIQIFTIACMIIVLQKPLYLAKSTLPISKTKNSGIETAEMHLSLHAFFYKQHFYKQHQTGIGKKSSKC